jgi:hypothetical protein
VSQDESGGRADQTAAATGLLPARAERLFLRLTLLQTVLAAAGLFTAAVALYAALVESEAVRRQSAAIVWPYVQVILETNTTEGAEQFEVRLSNAGVGPARMGQVRLTFGGDVRRDWPSVLAAVDSADADFAWSFVTGRVLKPGEEVRLFATSDPVAASRLFSALQDETNAFRVCYCSIYDECWVREAADPRAAPQDVTACPDYADAAFLN